MFERYTEKARRVIFFARYEASQFGAAQIETEHILLGLMREDKNLATHFFNRSQFSIEAVRNKIEERATVRERIPTTVDLPLSEESKLVLKLAAEESERLDHRHIGTEHLLFGLLLVKESLAFALLEECGVKAEDVREWLKELNEEKESIHCRDRTTVRECFSDADSRHRLAALIDSLNAWLNEWKTESSDKWVDQIAEVCLEYKIFTVREMADELERVAAMRQLSTDAETLLRLLAAKDLAEPNTLIALAIELRQESRLKEFIAKLRREPESE